MIDVALLGIIRRWHLRDQVPLREIARRLGISRNTVRRYIRAETIEPAYADRRPRSSLDKYTLKLSAWLKTEAAKSRKQRRTLKQLHLELRALGYEGSYDRVAAFARRWKLDQLERVNSASKSTFSEWGAVFGDAKMTTALLDRLTHHCNILETGNDSYRFKNSSTQLKRKEKPASKVPVNQ